MTNIMEELSPTRALVKKNTTVAPLKSGVTMQDVNKTATESKNAAYSKTIQDFLDNSAGNQKLETPRNAVISMIKNGESEEFMANAINEQILPKYKESGMKAFGA